MIARSRLVFAIVLLASMAAHLAAMTLIWSEPTISMEGGAAGAQPSLGSSFADLAQGVQQPVKAVSEATAPQAAPEPPLEKPVTAPDPALQPVATPDREAVAPQTSDPAAQAPVTPDDVTAAIPDPAPVRPRMRTRPPEPTKAKPTAKPAAPQGNATQNATAGTQNASSRTRADARQASRATTSNAEGNAAASNYPGLVMQRLSRVPRPESSTRGTAVVQFSIAPDGGLASASIARSSGSAALDRAALAMVGKAQPFPPPPSGARRSYSINIKGR